MQIVKKDYRYLNELLYTEPLENVKSFNNNETGMMVRPNSLL